MVYVAITSAKLLIPNKLSRKIVKNKGLDADWWVVMSELWFVVGFLSSMK